MLAEGDRYRNQSQSRSQDDLSDDELWADYDPEHAAEALRATAGSWKVVDGERLKADIRRWRGQGSRPVDRPYWRREKGDRPMVARTIEVDPHGEVARVLDAAASEPVVLIKDGVRFRVSVERETDADIDPWANYDPERVVEGMRKAEGVITPEEAKRWIENIHRWRREGSRNQDEL
jgi:hypothetical protein